MRLPAIDSLPTANSPCRVCSGLWGDKFMRNGDGFLCVYSITSKSSFEELEVFRDQILRAKDVDKVREPSPIRP